MTPDRWIVTVLGLALVVFIVWFFWLKKSRGARASETSGGYQEAMVLVKGGYTPDTVVVQHGKPVRLNFRREETSACSEMVVLPPSARAPPSRPARPWPWSSCRPRPASTSSPARWACSAARSSRSKEATMDGWLSILIFVVLFFLMMRFGCGAHMAHGHGSQHDGHDGHDKRSGVRPATVDASDAFDPVCGMEVRSGEGYAMAFGGREHHFCSRDCLDRFESDPARYTNGVVSGH